MPTHPSSARFLPCKTCQVSGEHSVRDLAGLVPNGTLPTDLQFTDQRRETTLGIYDYKARFYSPRLGRFLSADTLVPGVGSQHLSRYMYVTGNPVRYNDPTGHARPTDEDRVHRAKREVYTSSPLRDTRKAVEELHGDYSIPLLLGIATVESGGTYNNELVGIAKDGTQYPHGVMGITCHTGTCYHGPYKNTWSSRRQNVKDSVCWLDSYAFPRAVELSKLETGLVADIHNQVLAHEYEKYRTTEERNFLANLVAAAQLYAGTGSDKCIYLFWLADAVENIVPSHFGYADQDLANALRWGADGSRGWFIRQYGAETNCPCK